MDIDFVKLMASKTDEGLQECIDNRKKYNPDAVYAAIDQLKFRGRIFTDEELNIIKSDIEKQQEVSKQRVAEANETSTKWDKNVVVDPNEIELFSQKAIYGFTIFFGIFFGSILLSYNLKKVDKKNYIFLVILFGILFTTIQLWALSYIPRNTGLTMITSFAGAFVLNKYFWTKYIGEETKYRAKAIWTPLIIGLVIGGILIYLTIVAGEV
jgi:hypothetical protein